MKLEKGVLGNSEGREQEKSSSRQAAVISHSTRLPGVQPLRLNTMHLPAPLTLAAFRGLRLRAGRPLQQWQ